MASYSRLSLTERMYISQHLKRGISISGIAGVLGRSKSTISSEVRREEMTSTSYCPYKAQRHAQRMGQFRVRHRKIQGPLESIILLLLVDKRLSPEQINGYLKRKYHEVPELQVSTEIIYRWAYQHPMRGLLTQRLRRKRGRRRKRGTHQIYRGGIKNKVSIHDRPPEVISREEPGHWEGDLIVGPGNHSVMGSLVERSSRYLILVPLKSKSSEEVTKAFEEKLMGFPPHMRKTLTYDQGSEMAEHELFYERTGIKVYFADPRSPWQRGSIENANGLIREFFPKRAHLEKISAKRVKAAQELLQNRPRKCLSFYSPREVFVWLSESPERLLSGYPSS